MIIPHLQPATCPLSDFMEWLDDADLSELDCFSQCKDVVFLRDRIDGIRPVVGATLWICFDEIGVASAVYQVMPQ